MAQEAFTSTIRLPIASIMAESGNGDAASLAARLSERQRQCLALVAEGRTSKEIGRELNLSPSTVDNHLRAALERLGYRSRAEAANALRGRLGAREREPVDISSREQGLVEMPESARPVGRVREERSPFRLPPLGGRPNRLSMRRRAFHVVQIALLGVMGLTALVMTIAGLVALLSR